MATVNRDDNDLARDPVEHIPGEETRRPLKDKIGLCLSGGGYRAMLFHLGTLWRLNELGLLRELDRISSVSGGSITSAVLGMNWSRLGFDAAGVAQNFEREVVTPVRRLADKTIDRKTILGGIFLPGSIGSKVVKAYRKHVYGDATLQAFPDEPRFILNATSLQSGALWRFSKPYLWDYRVGKIANPNIQLAAAVAASSAFPPVLSPAFFEFNESDFEPGTGNDLQRPPFTTEVYMTDGGVYDNLGLETVWKRYKTVLVSNAGGRMKEDEKPPRAWIRQSIRVLKLIDNQVRSLRIRQLIASYIDGRREGAYWGIRTDIRHYGLPDALDCPIAKTTELANESTRLRAMDSRLQQRLINWGYAVCDAAIRSHYDKTKPKPEGFPYPGTGV